MTSPMAVVSNTSPILNLAIIDRLDLLHEQFAEVLIPPAVLTELQLESDLAGAGAIRQAIQAGWLRVVQLHDTHLAHVLALELDEGEAAAIALALEFRAKPVLMDEHDGRAKAEALGLEPIGVLGILLRAKHDGSLDSVKAAMQALRQEAGFFIASDLLETVLAEAGEGEPSDVPPTRNARP